MQISAFGDEIATDFEEQLNVLNQLNIPCLDLRTAWGVNVLKLTDDQVSQIKALCDEHGITIACIGSPIGKSPIEDPIEIELDNLERIIEIAKALNTNRVRIFSFYPPDTSTNENYDDYVEEAVVRLKRLAEIAARHGELLLLENEKGIVGDTMQRCLTLIEAVNSTHVRFIWDPANFVQVGDANKVDEWWDRLHPYINYVHIKDARLSDGSVTPAGEGDGQVELLLRHLRDIRYDGILSLEPHLAVAGHSGGFSGPDGMEVAVNALRNLLDKLNWAEDA